MCSASEHPLSNNNFSASLSSHSIASKPLSLFDMPLPPTPRVAALALLLVSALSCVSAAATLNSDGTTTHNIEFNVDYLNVTRLCHTKQLLAVNGQFPGPTTYVRTGDQVNVKVTNLVNENISIHWHGVRQFLTNWYDGPAYITQCPLEPNTSFTHKFSVVRESGTLWWHAHNGWLRGTLYGAFVILPRSGVPYPFPIQPVQEFPIVLGEWWNNDVLQVEAEALATGGGQQLSDALTINGQPGLLYNCSQQDAEVFNVKKGETYLLRLVNAAMNFQLYFQIANHTLTVVETDCSFSKPYTTNVVLLAPGQTADVLVTADQAIDEYYVASSCYSPPPTTVVPYPESTTTAIFRYEGAKQKTVEEMVLPAFPAANDSAFAMNYLASLRSLNSEQYPAQVPQTVDQEFIFTVGYALYPCDKEQSCHLANLPDNHGIAASVNNITFELPSVSILQAYYESTHFNVSGIKIPLTTEGTYSSDFPGMPQYQYNYTGTTLANLEAEIATKVRVVEYNANVQLVLQSAKTLFFESHPFHLHGYNFYVVGFGEGNYDPEKDPADFNLVDPPAMNTIAIPLGGWVAVRFVADNPGVWLMHCHFEMHTSWGMIMVWIVKDGTEANQKLPPPPADFPKCAGSPSDFNLVLQTIEQDIKKGQQEADDAVKRAEQSVTDKLSHI